MDWKINCVKPLVIGGVMVSVMQAMMVTVQLVVAAWMESMVQLGSLVAHTRVMQYDLESLQAETELMGQSESESMAQTEAAVWQASVKLPVYTGKQR